MTNFRPLAPALLLAAFAAVVTPGAAQTPGPPAGELSSPEALGLRLRTLARLPGEPSRCEAAGVTREGLPLWTLESTAGFSDPRRRIVLVGGLDGDPRSIRAIEEAIAWYKTAAAQAVRDDWIIVAMPCGNPEGLRLRRPSNSTGGFPRRGYPPLDGFFFDPANPEARYIWRWLSFQAPDMVVEVVGGSTTGLGLDRSKVEESDTLEQGLTATDLSELGLTPAVTSRTGNLEGGEWLRRLLSRQEGLLHSPAHQVILRRQQRTPLQTARLLADRYPQQPSVSYIPAVAWINSLRLSRLTGEEEWREKALAQMRSWLVGERPSLAGAPGGVQLAGHAAFAELALSEKNEAAERLSREAARNFVPAEPGGLARHGKFWCEDMFMASLLLSRASSLDPEAGHLDLLTRTLMRYSSRLQQSSGLFHHAADGPWAWGRGNGFASLALAETLAVLPADHPDRRALVAVHRRQLDAIVSRRTPEGAIRQVIDHPGSYREVTATAMNLASLARGIRLGWLDPSLRPAADALWKGLAARIANDGRLADVCTGTGAGAGLRHYYDRPAIFGLDDRGGAMSLLASIEMALLTGEAKERTPQ